MSTATLSPLFHHPAAPHVSNHVSRHAGTGIGGSLAHTFAHAAVAAFAWHGVSALFRGGHGVGLLIVVVLAIAVVVHLWRRRARTMA